MAQPPNNDPAKGDSSRQARPTDFKPGNTLAKGHGAPQGNSNGSGNLRHGLRTGKLPKKLQYVEHRTNELRRNLEAAVTQSKGEVGIVDAAAINSACKWERHGLLCQHWLRHEAPTLTVDQRLKFSEAIAKASDNRDKNIRALGLEMERAPWVLVVDPPANGAAHG